MLDGDKKFWELFEADYKGKNELDGDFKDLFMSLVRRNFKQRPRIEKIMEHKWLKKT